MARLKASSAAAGPGEPLGASTAPSTRRTMWSREVGWFVAIGVVSTAGQALLYWALRLWWPPAAANLVSLLVLTVLNTEANRRLTFRHAAAGPARAHLGAGGLFLLGYLFTSGAVLWFKHAQPAASPAAETGVLAATSVAVTVVRFVVLRLAVFGSPARRRG
ncbi:MULTISPECIES: GtrA family protein [unclassified Streptomyces]|uniref:GtrA family protein n=1 Tax=unclassified Streptomyces TaxID=2593676 RepID=UPI00244302CF|nr:GtrA family protein [Streptomyces sp. DH41]MDG9725043.1 GtrA family protein [Streptomyces sp. DH41]